MPGFASPTALIIPCSKSLTRGSAAPARGVGLTALVTMPPTASRFITPSSSLPYPAVPAARTMGLRKRSWETVTASLPSVMSTGSRAAAHAALVPLEILHRGVRDRARHGSLMRRRREVLRLGGGRAETRLDEYGRHERGNEHPKACLLHAAARARMHLPEVSLHDFGEVGRFTQMLVLLH